ncbi:MAG: hypothetical protein NXI17_16115 [Alphaproteobacteria bacterium]|nr:hypothetical protein [Alphaproteobacteria bacterium]
MKSCRAVAYLIEVRKLRSKSSENLRFGDFDGVNSLRAVISGILNKYSKYQKLNIHEKLFKIELNKSNSGPLVGRFMSGDYGQAGEIIEATNGKTAHKMKKSEALSEPFCFHIAVPDSEKRGIVCLQQTGLAGVKGIFETAVVGLFETQHPNYRLHVRQLTVSDTLSQLLNNGSVEEIIVEKHEIPSDIADRFGAGNKSYPGKFVYSIQPKTGILAPNILKKDGLIAFAKGERKLEDVFEFDDNGFDVVKTKIRIGEEIKMVNLTKPDSISSSFDISNDVVIGPDGYPTPKSLEVEFNKIVTDLARRGGIRL